MSTSEQQLENKNKIKAYHKNKLQPIKHHKPQPQSLTNRLHKFHSYDSPNIQMTSPQINKAFSNKIHDHKFQKSQISIPQKNIEQYCDESVSIYSLRKINHKANLLKSNIMAKGRFRGTNNIQIDLKQYQNIQFKGNFSGIFEFVDQKQFKNQQKKEGNFLPFTFRQQFYFQGEIKNIKIHKIQEQPLKQDEETKFEDLQYFKGFFQGHFFREDVNNNQLDEKTIQQVQKGDIQFFLPAIVNFDIRKITQINLQKSLANLQAILKIQIQINPALHYLLINPKTKKFKKKLQLSVDFHRSRPFNLPFYNPDDFEDQDEDTLYQWQDDWQGVDMNCEWIKEKNILSYQIRANFTAEIDNSYGIFYAPFNLNILRIIMDIHGIKLKEEIIVQIQQGKQIKKQKKFKLNITVCDFSDFNKSRECTPYINFNQLEILGDKQNYQEVFKIHIDRLTKINSLQFIDQGEFSIADNRLYLFPYHKRVFMNKNTLGSQLSWVFGTASRTSLLKTPRVRTVKQGYQLYQKGNSQILDVAKWQFVHIQIPIFKYPVIDMIRIFVPITILSLISLLIFWQQNGKNEDNVTVLSTRIGSGIGILFAYVALIPTIRQNLPPSPAVTLVQLLVIISIVPNLLAIISVFFRENQTVKQFFDTYIAFTDPLFIISFILCLFSLLTLIIMMVIYSKKDYKTNFTIKKFEPSGLKKAKAPFYMYYMDQLRLKRKDIIIKGEKQLKEDLNYQKYKKQVAQQEAIQKTYMKSDWKENWYQ